MKVFNCNMNMQIYKIAITLSLNSCIFVTGEKIIVIKYIIIE